MQGVAPGSGQKRPAMLPTRLPVIDKTEELTPAQMAKWSVKVAGRADNVFPIFASASKEASAPSKRTTSQAGPLPAQNGSQAPVGAGHIGTSRAGALLEASQHFDLSKASLAAQHAYTLGAVPNTSNLQAGSTIGVPSSSFRREDRRTTRSGQILRQDEAIRRSSGVQDIPLLERPTQTFVSGVGGSRDVLPEEVHPFRLPYTNKRPRTGAWQAWTDEAVKELEVERQRRIRLKRKERKLANAQNGDDAGKVDDLDDEDSLFGDDFEGDGIDGDEGERPVRLSIRKSMVLLQSLRQSRLLHMTALLPPFSIRNAPSTSSATWMSSTSNALISGAKRTRSGIVNSGALPQGSVSLPEFSYISPLPPSLTHHFDLRQPHFLLQLGCADVRIGPHLFLRTKFWEVRPDMEGIQATRMAAQRTGRQEQLSGEPSVTRAGTQTPRGAASTILNSIPPQGIWANDPAYRPRPPIIVVEFQENPSMRYVLPLWATAVECTRFLRAKPSADMSKDKAQYELVLTFGVPALGSAARSHSAALVSAEAVAQKKARQQKEVAKRKAEEKAAKEAAEAKAQAAAAAVAAAIIATATVTTTTTGTDVAEVASQAPTEPEPRPTMQTRSRMSTQAAPALDKPAGLGSNIPTVPTARQETPPPLPPTHPT
ncbi:unnamed protein product, partial [Tilletia controversa]